MTTTSTSIEPAADSGRYSLVRELGSGASGSVFLALDAETGRYVALKKLFGLDQTSVQRLKREFRALTDLHHRNLVKLFDLQRGSDACFLTMEYVDGVELRSRLADWHKTRATQADDKSTRAVADPSTLAELIRVFAELANGVRALHRAGLLHRDLKPSNILIAQDRVVVLDFGLVLELGEQRLRVTQEGNVAGTPAYMPPEQARGEALTEASDWYAFGAILYEALCGHLPIDARDVSRLLHRKLHKDPEPLSRLVVGVPHALTDLCMQLLQRSPEQRPTGEQILDVLAALDARVSKRHRPSAEFVRVLADLPPNKPSTPLIGREPATAQLMAALRQACEGVNVTVSVRGSSGTGKTALIEHCLNEVAVRAMSVGQTPLVLRSRCYERESMPFKSLDGAMDDLVQHLAGLDDLRVANLLPRAVAELTQLFPTFQRLHSVQRLLLKKHAHSDAAQTRHRAEQGLRQLIARVAQEQPVLLWIDDLQWGDLDSTSILRDWLSQPAASPITLIVSYRVEELETSACLRALEIPMFARTDHPNTLLIELSPLGETDVEALCRQRLPAETPPSVVAKIAFEAQGNPFWILQLSTLAAAQLERQQLELKDLSIGELVTRASALLPPGARAILDVLAIAGRPLPPHLALNAAEVGQEGRALVQELQSLRLLRSRVVNGERLLEVSHDRVRESVQAALDTLALRRVHDHLLRVMELSGRADADWLHQLALGAEEPNLALRYGLTAAERAHSSLAFVRAIELYQRCLGLTESKSERAKLYGKLAGVLAHSRRGAEAADAYLQAAELVEPSEQPPLLRLAASHLLRTGRFDEGERLVQRVLGAQAIDIPTSNAGLYAAIAWERVRLALRGSSFVRRDPQDAPATHLRTAELYGVLAVETQFYAPLRAALFQARALRLGLDAGDPSTAARALCLTATVSCIAGTPRAAQLAKLQLARAEAIAKEVEDQDLRSELFSARTVCALLLGDLPEVLEASDEANRTYETQRTGGEQGDYYYLFAVHAARIGALQYFGRYKQADLELRELLARADATANRTAVLQASLLRACSDLALNLAAEAQPRLDRERDELPQMGIGILHLLHLVAVMSIACSTFEFDWAFGVIDRFWMPVRSSPLRHGRALRFVLHSTRARLVLNRWVVDGRQGDPISFVREDLKTMSTVRTVAAREFVRAFKSRVAYLRGDVAAAVDSMRKSAQEFARLGLLEETCRAQYALGCMLESEEGETLRAQAHAVWLELGVVNPLGQLRSSHPELVIDAKLTVP